MPSPSPTKLEFSLEEIETLARLEHRRWYIDRRLLGVTYGEARSARPQRHPLLVEWERLPENVRETNRNEVKRLTTILAEVKFEVQREHKILAFDETLGEAVRELESSAATLLRRCRGYRRAGGPQSARILPSSSRIPLCGFFRASIRTGCRKASLMGRPGKPLPDGRRVHNCAGRLTTREPDTN